MSFFIALGATFFGAFIIVPIFFAFCRFFGLYTTVNEKRCHVYVLFGKVELIINEPGLHFLFGKLGWKAPIVTEIASAKEFWPAKESHQDYLEKIPNGYTCHFLRAGDE